MRFDRWRRATRHLRVRVTAAATLAAILLAIAGAVVFTIMFQRSQLAGTDGALRTIASQLVPGLSTAADPRLVPVTRSTRTTILQLIAPDGTVRQTVTTSSRLGPTSQDGRTLLATADQLAAARSAATSYTQHDARVVLTPFPRADGTWVLVTAADLEQVEDAAHNAKVAFLVVVPLVVVLIAFGAWLMSGAVLRPVERIRADAAALRRQVAVGSRHPENRGRVHEPNSGDGIESLAHTLNGLLADLAGAADRQRGLVADAGHELRTPLTVLRTELELADRPDRDPAYLRDSVQHARSEVERLSALAEDLLLLADAERRVARDARPTDVAEIVADSVRAHRAVAAGRSVALLTDLEADPVALVDAASLRRVVDNLLGNALAVTRTAVTVSLAGVGHSIVLAVDDDGPGFPADFLPHAFERFRRADDARHRTGSGGAGLGLAIVAAVATAHGGRAEAANTDVGARVSVTLPRS